MSQVSWLLDPRLEHDSVMLGELALCRVLLSADANYPWLILVPRRPGVVEIIDLEAVDQGMLMTEIARTAHALKRVTRCHKLNIAALGNSVPQLHVHVVARFRDDAAGARPIWGAVPARAYDEAQRARLAAALREAIGIA
jgi:diadenosine tetraphosphate (Ap4A) HIT family hydrolase